MVREVTRCPESGVANLAGIVERVVAIPKGKADHTFSGTGLTDADCLGIVPERICKICETGQLCDKRMPG